MCPSGASARFCCSAVSMARLLSNPLPRYSRWAHGRPPQEPRRNLLLHSYIAVVRVRRGALSVWFRHRGSRGVPVAGRRTAISSSETLMPLGWLPSSSSACTLSPVCVSFPDEVDDDLATRPPKWTVLSTRPRNLLSTAGSAGRSGSRQGPSPVIHRVLHRRKTFERRRRQIFSSVSGASSVSSGLVVGRWAVSPRFVAVTGV